MVFTALHAIYQCVTQDDTQLYTGWLSKAEEFGFIAVWPQAEDEPIGENGVTGFQWDERGPIGARWNAGMCDECNGFSYSGQFVLRRCGCRTVFNESSRDLLPGKFVGKVPVISGQKLPMSNKPQQCGRRGFPARGGGTGGGCAPR